MKTWFEAMILDYLPGWIMLVLFGFPLSILMYRYALEVTIQ